MRRKPRARAANVPAELRVFNRDRPLREWLDARKAWWDQNPDAWPDLISVLGPGANVRARRMGRRAPYPDLDEGEGA